MDITMNEDFLNNHEERLKRYALAKKRSLEMANYISAVYGSEHVREKTAGRPNSFDKLSAKLRSCGSYLVFKHFYNEDKLRLHSTVSCSKHLLCPFCAIKRTVKCLERYHSRIQTILKHQPNLKLFMVTLTVKDGEDLVERFQKLRWSLKKYQQQRRDALKGQKYVEYAKALGGVFSIEIKRGKHSQLWHPHVHMIWICEQEPDKYQISNEWNAITQDSYIIDVRECYGDSQINIFLEVFKYSLKFSEMSCADNFHAFQAISGSRLIEGFGILRNETEEQDIDTEEIVNEEMYQLLLFKFNLSKRKYLL